MKQYARYRISIKTTATHREDPVYQDLHKAKVSSRKLTEYKLYKVSVFDTETEELIFESSNGNITTNKW